MATVSANDAIEIVLGQHRFHPTFTYPIYGENELIYGYENIKITVEYDAVSLLPLVEMSFDGPPAADADEPLEKLLEFMPKNTFTDRDEWEKARQELAYAVPGFVAFEIDEFSVYKSNIDECRELLHRFRTFVLFFIEAGSFIDEEDERWELYTMVETQTKAFAGFVTVYPYFFYSNAEDFENSASMLVRKRISQFVVLPPYQHRGVGCKLYTGLATLFQKDDTVRQITVEDPNEAFDVMRDRSDLVLLARDEQWSQMALPVDEEALAAVIKRTKLVPRQVQRCLEISLLGKYPSEPLQYRKLVKQRLFEHNYEGLKDLDEGTQAIMLRDVYGKVVEDYGKYLESSDDQLAEPDPKRLKTN